MASLYAAMTAILALAFIGFLIEEALRSAVRADRDEREQQAEPTIKLV